MYAVPLQMAPSPTWLSLNDLGQIYGVSEVHCGRALQKQGWRDRNGHPTNGALTAGAACINDRHKPPKATLWNAEVCKDLMEKNGLEPINRDLKIMQWAQLLEALDEGSPSIDATAEQMAKDLPRDLVNEVNDQLSKRGCGFQVI